MKSQKARKKFKTILKTSLEKKKITYYNPTEEKINVFSHAFGLLLSLMAFVLLIGHTAMYGSALQIVSASIYGLSLIILYAASTYYHHSQEPSLRYRLNILDHAAIYVLIAGTYTPFALLVLKGWIGWSIFGVSWGLAVIGIILKLFFTGKYERISTVAYVLMGWLVVIVLKPLINNMPFDGLMWLFGGGLFYTIGAILYSIKRIKFNHAIFHFFVLFGSICHFIAVFVYVLKK